MRKRAGKLGESHETPTGMVIDLVIDDSIVDHRQELYSSRMGRFIGIRVKDLCSMNNPITIYDMRKARLGEEVSCFLATTANSIFPIKNTEYGEVYKSSDDERLFQRFFSYVIELVYFTSIDIAKRESSFNDDYEALIWTYYADRLDELFPGFLTAECQQAR